MVVHGSRMAGGIAAAICAGNAVYLVSRLQILLPTYARELHHWCPAGRRMIEMEISHLAPAVCFLCVLMFYISHWTGSCKRINLLIALPTVIYGGGVYLWLCTPLPQYVRWFI